ncbi:uncharacterized protein LOC103492137 isoform X1 [Cucumis melo]|uniref:Uncharacterized protein LOC103492137 isoform X1 n=1 Tax=Cucumis melo TaxID=3656 RepID=A0A1S3BQK2_CUCME|nr:uncharacterized protein LOC103492137 isoform X1 [Cucumis melo]
MDPSSSNTKKRGCSNEAEEVQDHGSKRSCTLPNGTQAGDLIRDLYESFMAGKVQELKLEMERRMPNTINNSLSGEDEIQAREIVDGLIKEKRAKWESEFRQLLINELDEIAMRQLKPLPPTPRKFKLCFGNEIKDTMYHKDEIKSIDNEVLKIEICDAYSNTVISNDSISFAMVELFLKEAGSDTPISREKTMELISFNHLQFRLQHGIGYVKGLVIKSSKYWKSNHFVLGVKVIDEPILMGFGTIEEASSGPFRVLTKRSKGNRKEDRPTKQSEVWRLVGISKNGVYHRILSSELGIKTVGDFLRRYHEMSSPTLEEFLKRRMSKLDEWDDIVKHAKTCVDYDPTEYDQTHNDKDLVTTSEQANSNQSSKVHNHQDQSVKDNNDNLMGVGLHVSSSKNLEVHNHQSQIVENNNNNLMGTEQLANTDQNLEVLDHQNISVQDNNNNLTSTDVQVNSDPKIRTNLEEANHSKEDCEVGENAILPRTVSDPNQQWFLDNIDLDLDSPSNIWAAQMILDSPNPYGIVDCRVDEPSDQFQELQKLLLYG